ncbi:hypothetical protein E6Q11_04370, partial [Candidatus Dojkabacteria bacterium]
MDETKTGNQPINGNDGNPSGEGQPTYSDNERQLYARAKKAEEKVKELEQQISSKGGNTPEPTKDASLDSAWKERMELI